MQINRFPRCYVTKSINISVSFRISHVCKPEHPYEDKPILSRRKLLCTHRAHQLLMTNSRLG